VGGDVEEQADRDRRDPEPERSSHPASFVLYR
jgi:hypothetical protein